MQGPVTASIKTFTIKNVGSAPMTLNGSPIVKIAGANPSDFTVVTQPAFVHARGDRYLAEVDDDDVGFLWRCGSLLRAGIAVRGSSDGPYGPADPWQAMRAGVDRRTASGAVLGADERVSPEQVLALYTGARRVALGAAADLCLLRVPLTDALAALDADAVRLTVIEGVVVRTS